MWLGRKRNRSARLYYVITCAQCFFFPLNLPARPSITGYKSLYRSSTCIWHLRDLNQMEQTYTSCLYITCYIRYNFPSSLCFSIFLYSLLLRFGKRIENYYYYYASILSRRARQLHFLRNKLFIVAARSKCRAYLKRFNSDRSLAAAGTLSARARVLTFLILMPELENCTWKHAENL